MHDNTRFHITSYLRNQMRERPPKLAFAATDAAEWRVWRQQLRDKLRDLLAPWPEPTPLAPEVIHVTDAGDHWQEEIVLQSHTNVEMSCMPLLTESARNDNCFPWPYTEPTLVRLREVYRATGAEDCLFTHIYDGDHRYYGHGVVEFWQQHL
jgi:hypothetical protein